MRRVFYSFHKATVKSMIRSCVECLSIDPVPVHWGKGKLNVDLNWSWLGIDITHYGCGQFLTLIDCGLSRFAIW